MVSTLAHAQSVTFDRTSTPDLVDAVARAIWRLVIAVIGFSCLLSLLCVMLAAPLIRRLPTERIPRRIS
jgi:hypothetical protein